MRTLAGRAVVAAALLAAAGCQQRQTYSECILEHVKPGLSDRGTSLVARACAEQTQAAGEAAPAGRYAGMVTPTPR